MVAPSIKRKKIKLRLNKNNYAIMISYITWIELFFLQKYNNDNVMT